MEAFVAPKYDIEMLSMEGDHKRKPLLQHETYSYEELADFT